MRTGVVLTLAALGVFLTLPSHAATTLLPPSGGIDLSTVSNYGNYNVGSGSQTLTDSTGTVSGSSVLGLDPSVSGSITALTVGAITYAYGIPIGFDSESSMFYQFAVNGPAGQTVGVNISSVGNAIVSTLNPTSGYNLNATAYLSVFSDPGAPIFTATACAGAPSLVSDPCSNPAGLSGSFNVAQMLDVQTNTPYYVNIYASDSMESPYSLGGSGTFSASSSVDPTITLATNDPAYSLQFGPGLIGATPEPSGFTLMASGLFGLVAVARRRISLL